MATINLKKSLADPIARDVGNMALQNRVVSQTQQFSLFTTNENAAWAAKIQLQKNSFPFATIKISVNRNKFKLQVADVFKLNYAKYGIVGMVCRVLLVEEANLQSEKIILHVMEDIFSVSKKITVYTDPTDSAGQAPDYTPIPFTVDTVFEAPYVMTEGVEIVPLAKREADTDLGMQVHLSTTGSSYVNAGQANNIKPYGTLTADYDIGNPIDNSIGMTVSFVESDIDLIDSISWPETLAGNLHTLIIGNELMTFQDITPVSGTIYALTNVIRGRYGTQQEDHSTGAAVWIVSNAIGMISHSEILPFAPRKFKLLPFNSKFVGNIADANEISLTPQGKAKTPYIPINFVCNGVSFASRYTADCVLTWDARKRGEGAGIGTPGIVLAETDREGYFDVEVWVASVLVRTTTDIDAVTWTYTSAMNTTDNGALATEIEFRITNWRTESGVTYTSDSVSVTTKLTT
jgi:hypothetical protein